MVENERNRTCIDGVHGKCAREKIKPCRNCPFYKDIVEVKLLGTEIMLTRILGSDISLNKQQRDAIESYMGPTALDRFNDLKDKTIASYEEAMNGINIFEPLNDALNLLTDATNNSE